MALLAGATAASVALFKVDSRVARLFGDSAFHVRHPDYTTAALRGSIPTETLLMITGGAVWGVSRLRHDDGTADVAFHSTEAVLSMAMVIQVVRGALGRGRPWVVDEAGEKRDGDPYEFQLLHGFTSFNYRSYPSMHAMASFAVATALSQEMRLRNTPNRQIISPALYAAATIPALSRMYLDEHWTSDIALGAFLGVFSGQKVVLYSHEHPDDPFPEFLEGPATFQGSQLGHPLIPAAQCVRNDVDFSAPTRVLLVSGSNMSGKSTLLRTVGVNTVLAMAGAPVRAQRMRLTPLQIGASIRINDSLHEGSSRFYAEITRLRQIYGLEERSPALLFLLDELLQGTNSRDRRIGAEGIVRAFVERGAVGLISTHDLALAEISGLADGTLRNVHFEDELRDGQLKFDFRLRAGVVTRSNGIELMRSIGLKV